MTEETYKKSGLGRYLNNSAWIMSDNLISSASGLIALVFVARIFGPQECGAYAYVFALAQIFSAIGQMGMAEHVSGQLCTALSIVQAGGAQKAKSIIGQCDPLIGSRFHARVNAMSQGVPAIGTCWSHKHRALFGNYGYDEGLSAVELPDEGLHKALASVLTPDSRAQISERLMTASKLLKQTVRRMWGDVYSTVGLD